MSVVENIQNVRAKIAAAAEKSGRTAEDVLLLAVSKTKPVELIGEAVQAGCLSLGENKVQEIMEKYEEAKRKQLTGKAPDFTLPDVNEKEVNLSNYKGKYLLIDFWASWCGPCKMVAPIISQIAEEYNGKVKVCKVNVDDQGELAAQNAIVSIPTVILFIDGKPVKKIVGAHSLDDYEDAIDEFI